jgi:transposase
MGFMQGQSRLQTFVTCLDDMVSDESKARIIDRFVNVVDLGAMGFAGTLPADKGRPGYDPADMVKLYMLGYERGVRSSRKLEALCHTDIEAAWIMGTLAPDFKTIADFRKVNAEAFVALFKEFVDFCDSMGLFGKEVIAIDGTKLKASNSRKARLSKKGLKRTAEHHAEKVNEYLKAMDEADAAGDMEAFSEAYDSAEHHSARQNECEAKIEQLDATGTKALSLTDPECAMMASSNKGLDMAVNVQAAVDAANHLVATFDVSSSPADTGQLSGVAKAAEEALRKGNMTHVADKGYCDSDDIEACEEAGIDVVVACPNTPKAKGIDSAYAMSKFSFDANTNSYTCPEGCSLPCCSKDVTEVKRYKNKAACATCISKDLCVPNGKDARIIMRFPNAGVLDKARAKYAKCQSIYALRQQIAEHPFGTIKRSMGFSYLLVRGIKMASAEVALAFSGYNLKRALSTVGFTAMMEGLDHWGELVRRAAVLKAASEVAALDTNTPATLRLSAAKSHMQRFRRVFLPLSAILAPACAAA